MDSRPLRAPFLWTVLSSALAGACLNLATSVLDHPRALESGLRLGLPLAAGFGLLLAFACLGLGLVTALGRWLHLPTGPLYAGFELALALAAALAPMVEVGMREASRERASVVVACAAGFVFCAGLATYALALQQNALAHERHVLLCLPLAAAATLGTTWWIEYHAASVGSRSLALLAGGLVVLASLRLAPRLAPVPWLAGLAALLLGHAALGARGDEWLPGSRRAGSVERPPVILLTVDTLRADRVLGDGPARVPTPTIDALADDSVVFTQARSAAPWTKPSLSTLLTGVAPLVHGMTNRRARLPEEVETLAERLHAAGYRTAGIGLNAHLERAFRLDQGFEDYAFPARLDYGLALGARLLERLAPARFPELFPSTTAIADTAVGWIDAHAEEPLFLWVHMLDPHWPYEPPPQWLEHPEREPRRWGEPSLVTNVQAGNLKPGQAEKERVQELYAGEIRYVDAELARILGALRAHGLYERALIVFASDHGEEFWEHGRYEHGHTLYDEVLRVPLLFKLPTGGPRTRVAAAVSTQALVPTVLDVLGVPFEPELLSSHSLVPWWRTPTEAREEPLFATGTYYFGEKRGVVFDGHKLVAELDTGRVELYDLGRDPGELHSLADPEARRKGLALVSEWEERCGDLRERLGLQGESAAEASDEVLRGMRKLGYAGSQ